MVWSKLTGRTASLAAGSCGTIVALPGLSVAALASVFVSATGPEGGADPDATGSNPCSVSLVGSIGGPVLIPRAAALPSRRAAPLPLSGLTGGGVFSDMPVGRPRPKSLRRAQSGRSGAQGTVCPLLVIVGCRRLCNLSFLYLVSTENTGSNAVSGVLSCCSARASSHLVGASASPNSSIISWQACLHSAIWFASYRQSAAS